MTTADSKLIILRGPSGAGKSTIARLLLESHPTRVAHIDQDYYRFMFRPAGGGSRPNSSTIHKMIYQNTMTALHDGYDVILEGILSVRAYGEILDKMFCNHPEQNYMFYFDISLEETWRRHSMRKTPNHGFTEDDMREWYSAAHRSNHHLEQIIPEEFSIVETISFIKKSVGL